MSLRNTFNTIQIDCRYPIQYIFTEIRKEFFSFSLKKNLINQNNRKSDKIQIACLKGGGGRVLQLHGPRLWWQLVFRGILFLIVFVCICNYYLIMFLCVYLLFLFPGIHGWRVNDWAALQINGQGESKLSNTNWPTNKNPYPGNWRCVFNIEKVFLTIIKDVFLHMTGETFLTMNEDLKSLGIIFV